MEQQNLKLLRLLKKMSIKQNPNRLDFYIGQSDKKTRIRKKRCTKCKEYKFMNEFYKNNQYKEGLRSICIPCALKISKKNNKNYIKINEIKSNDEIFHGRDVKCIGICGIKGITKIKKHYLPAIKDNFTRINSRKSGLNNKCKKCGRIYEIEKEYNILYSKYEKIYDKQKGKCKLCENFFDILHVDHNHETGKIRGLLCFYCNTRLGILEEKDFVIKSIKYLK